MSSLLNLELTNPGLTLHTHAVGTPYYVSPEVIAGNYTAKCDIWSLGVIAYMLLSGVPPFFGPDDNGTIQAVREGKWKFPDSLFKAVSPAAKSFISMCLSRQTSLRPSAAVAIKHKWFEILKNPDGSRDILKSKEFFQPDVKKNIHSIGSIAPLSTSRQNSSSLSLDNSLDSDVSTALNRDGLPHLHPSSQKMPPCSACQSPVRTMEILYNDSLSTHPPE